MCHADSHYTFFTFNDKKLKGLNPFFFLALCLVKSTMALNFTSSRLKDMIPTL